MDFLSFPLHFVNFFAFICCATNFFFLYSPFLRLLLFLFLLSLRYILCCYQIILVSSLFPRLFPFLFLLSSLYIMCSYQLIHLFYHFLTLFSFLFFVFFSIHLSIFCFPSFIRLPLSPVSQLILPSSPFPPLSSLLFLLSSPYIQCSHQLFFLSSLFPIFTAESGVNLLF